jgi:hypothetical protein
MQQLTREMRGIPHFLLKEYLVELGGALLDENTIAGAGWRVRLTKMEPYKIFSIQVGQTLLEMELEDDIAEDFLQRFAKKTLRAGA